MAEKFPNLVRDIHLQIQDKDHYYMIKRSIHQEDMAILHIYTIKSSMTWWRNERRNENWMVRTKLHNNLNKISVSFLYSLLAPFLLLCSMTFCPQHFDFLYTHAPSESLNILIVQFNHGLLRSSKLTFPIFSIGFEDTRN